MESPAEPIASPLDPLLLDDVDLEDDYEEGFEEDFDDDFDEEDVPTLQFDTSVVREEPNIDISPVQRQDAALTALLELAAADDDERNAADDDETLEFQIPNFAPVAFDVSQVDELMELEGEMREVDRDTGLMFGLPAVHVDTPAAPKPLPIEAIEVAPEEPPLSPEEQALRQCDEVVKAMMAIERPTLPGIGGPADDDQEDDDPVIELATADLIDDEIFDEDFGETVRLSDIDLLLEETEATRSRRPPPPPPSRPAATSYVALSSIVAPAPVAPVDEAPSRMTKARTWLMASGCVIAVEAAAATVAWLIW